MSLEVSTGGNAPVPLSLQYISAEIMPLAGGKFSVAMQATLLDEAQLEFVGQDLAHESVDTIDDALAVIRANVTFLAHASERPS